MDNYLEVRHLGKSFPGFALKDVSFELPKGYMMGLIGPNGSGKTTTIKLILDLLKRESGEIRVLGMDAQTDALAVRSVLGVVFDANCFCEEWRVSDVERNLSGFYASWNAGRFAELCTRFGLEGRKKVKALSKGMQMKLMLACALSYDAKLLILDEPTSGLDPISRDELLTLLSAYIEDGEHSVLFSTHITSDLERAADYITYIRQGEVFYTGSKDEFLERWRIVRGGPEELTDDLRRKALGLRTFSTGFEALIPADERRSYPYLASEKPTIDDILVFTNRKGEFDA